MSIIRNYYDLTKPGIVYGNLLTAAAGFFFAAKGVIDWQLFFIVMVGLALVVGSACAINNYYDRDIDVIMERTKNREIPSGRIEPRSALVFGIILGVLGGVLLFFHTNLLTFLMAALGWFVYLALYTPLKRLTGHSLWVGAISGATPPLVGYVAVTNTLDSAALALFIFLFIWQIAHFFAIAIYRYNEYTAAGVPLLVKGPPSARARHYARISFYISLVIMVLFALGISLPL